MSTSIAAVRARQILDSRGNPTVEVDVELASGASGRAAVPSGASTGAFEAVELRDGDGAAYLGKGVLRAVENVAGELAPALVGRDAADQKAIDALLVELDGTGNKGRLGANALLGCSLAVAKAAAADARVPLWSWLGGGGPHVLPVPLMNVVNGGAHAGNGLDVQEFMVVPVGAASFSEALRMGAEVFHHLKALLEERGLVTAVGDEGGFAPDLRGTAPAIEAILEAAGRAGHGGRVAIALDAAATELWRDGAYRLAGEGRTLTSGQLIDLYADLCGSYPIVSIEDPLAEDDRDAWIAFTRAARHRVQVIGDDLLTTNAGRVAQAAADGSCNAVLVKVNQAGTLTEAKAALDAGKAAGFGTIVSARSGETEDVAIAHLAVGWNAGQLKVGSFARSERLAKWNEVLRIADALGEDARFAGTTLLPARK